MGTHRFQRGATPYARALIRCMIVTGAGLLVLSGCSSSSKPKPASLKLSHNTPATNNSKFGPRRALAKPTPDPVYGVAASPRKTTGGIKLGGGYAKVGKRYRIGTRWYQPKNDPSYNRTGTASWYGTAFHGRKTANGEYFDMNRLSAAHPTLPLPSYVMVTNLANDRSIVVRVNDRGPYAHNRLIDLSRETARRLGFEHRGTAKVRVRMIGAAPLDGNVRFEESFLRRQPWYKKQLARR